MMTSGIIKLYNPITRKYSRRERRLGAIVIIIRVNYETRDEN